MPITKNTYHGYLLELYNKHSIINPTYDPGWAMSNSEYDFNTEPFYFYDVVNPDRINEINNMQEADDDEPFTEIYTMNDVQRVYKLLSTSRTKLSVGKTSVWNYINPIVPNGPDIGKVASSYVADILTYRLGVTNILNHFNASTGTWEQFSTIAFSTSTHGNFGTILQHVNICEDINKNNSFMNIIGKEMDVSLQSEDLYLYQEVMGLTGDEIVKGLGNESLLERAKTKPLGNPLFVIKNIAIANKIVEHDINAINSINKQENEDKILTLNRIVTVNNATAIQLHIPGHNTLCTDSYLSRLIVLPLSILKRLTKVKDILNDTKKPNTNTITDKSIW